MPTNETIRKLEMENMQNVMLGENMTWTEFGVVVSSLMSSPTIDTFCCVVDSSGVGIDTKLEFRIDLYTIVCIASSLVSMCGAVYQLLPRLPPGPRFKRMHFTGSRQKQIISWLAFADLMAALGIFMRSVYWLHRMNDGEANNNGGLFCAFASGWIQYFYTSTYFWNISYAIDVYLVLHQKEKRFVLYHLVCWGLPAITTSVGLSILYNPNLNCRHDIPNVLPNYLCTHIPLLLTMTINPFMYYASSKQVFEILARSRGRYCDQERRLASALNQKFFDIVLVFYICWLPNIINSLLLWSMWYNLTLIRTAVVSVWYIMAILNPLQAVFNVFVYRTFNKLGGPEMVLENIIAACCCKSSDSDIIPVDCDYDSDSDSESTPVFVNCPLQNKKYKCSH